MVYSGGILCYIYQDSIRILDVHGASETEDVIDLNALLAELWEHHPGSGTPTLEAIRSYQNGILTVIVNEPWVHPLHCSDVVINVRRDFVSPLSRIHMITREFDHRKTITDGRYMVCVPEMFNLLHGPDYPLKCYDLSNPESPISIIALSEFLRGYNCRFKLLGGWFYAFCVDIGSSDQPGGKERVYYNYCRFPIDDCCPAGPWKPGDFSPHSPHTPLPARLGAVRLFRGFDKDIYGWQQHDLEQDERTGEVSIVEDNRGSYKYRQVILPDPPAHIENSLDTRISEIVHRIDEYPCSSVKAVHQLPRNPLRNAQKRFHIEPSQSFINVSYDDNMTGPNQQMLHLSAGVRVPCSPIHRSMRQFPPRGAPQEICEVLRTFQDYDSVRATVCHVDERSLIIDAPQSDNSPHQGDHRIILVNFDSGIHFPGFKPLNLARLSDKISCEALYEPRTSRGACDEGKVNLDKLIQRDAEHLRQPTQNEHDGNQQEEVSESSIATHKNETPRSHPWFYTEPAMYLEIGKGFQFHRYPPKPAAGPALCFR